MMRTMVILAVSQDSKNNDRRSRVEPSNLSLGTVGGLEDTAWHLSVPPYTGHCRIGSTRQTTVFGCHNNAQFIALLTDYMTVSQQAIRGYNGRRGKFNTSLRWRCKIKLTGQLHALVLLQQTFLTC